MQNIVGLLFLTMGKIEEKSTKDVPTSGNDVAPVKLTKRQESMKTNAITDGKESSCSWVWQFSLQHWQPDALVMTMKHTSMMSTETQKPAYTIIAITKRLKAIRV